MYIVQYYIQYYSKIVSVCISLGSALAVGPFIVFQIKYYGKAFRKSAYKRKNLFAKLFFERIRRVDY